MERKVRVRGYKYRAYPNHKQQKFFVNTFGACRFVYNYYLEAKQQVWKEWHDTLTYAEMSRHMTGELKKEKPWLKGADSIALQQSLRDLDKAYVNFFRRRGGYPRYRTKRSKQSYRTMNVKGSVRIEGDAIRLPKAGKVKIVNTRAFEGRIISATVTMTAGGRWYISLLVEEEYEIKPNGGGKIGIDAGLKTLLTVSSGEIFVNPGTLRKHEKKLRRLHRELSRKKKGSKKGSKNREKARLRLAREYEKVADIRNDIQHKITHKLASENQVVCVEDLNVRGMMRNHRLARSISDASWSGLYRKLEYKTADHGGILVKVPRTYASSQICSCCGRKERSVKDLSIRKWRCPACGTEHDRDGNAAVNILNKGLEMLAS